MTAEESKATALVRCETCHVQPGTPCHKTTARRESVGRGVYALKHPHPERMRDYRVLISDQGGGTW